MHILHSSLNYTWLGWFFPSSIRTAKTQYRKFEANIPRKGIVRPQSQFPHSWGIYIFPRSDCPFCCRKICGPFLGIHKSSTDTWMWKLGRRPRNSFLWEYVNGIYVAVRRVAEPFTLTISKKTYFFTWRGFWDTSHEQPRGQSVLSSRDLRWMS